MVKNLSTVLAIVVVPRVSVRSFWPAGDVASGRCRSMSTAVLIAIDNECPLSASFINCHGVVLTVGINDVAILCGIAIKINSCHKLLGVAVARINNRECFSGCSCHRRVPLI